MKKILTTTALVGSLVISSAGIASAQTTVTGNLTLSYKAHATDTGAATKESGRFFGKESQINLTNKGKLNNGLDYVAGFSFELDGGDTPAAGLTSTAAGAFNENTYIDFISGNTTFSIGADHVQNADYTMTNLVGVIDPDDAVNGIAARATTFIASHNSNYGAYGFSITQKTPIGSFSASYTPDATAASAANDTLNVGTSAAVYDAGESAYELGFKGDLGVKGLEVGLFYNNKDSGGTAADGKGRMYAAKYNMGEVTVAAQRGYTQTWGTGAELDSDSFGIAYAINKDLSIGYTYAKTKATSAAGVVDPDKEKINQISLGYNLGAIAVGASYATVDNIGNNANEDGKSLVLRAAVNF